MSKAKSLVSRVSAKSHIVLPLEVRERLRVGPGDRVRFILDPDSLRIEQGTREDDEPFAAFSEWSSEADEEAFGDLQSRIRSNRPGPRHSRERGNPGAAARRAPLDPRFREDDRSARTRL